MDGDDLCNLTQDDEELEYNTLLQTLQQRYNDGKSCTFMGDILLSINLSTQKTDGTLTSQLSSRLHQALLVSVESQCLIVSGESGSGKTTISTNILKQFLGCCNTQHRKIRDTIEIADSIVGIFGSAKCTGRSSSSTRFAKLLQVYFSTEKLLNSCTITEYLLEKSRVTNTNNNECNFNIFYYLFAGRTEEELCRQLIDSPTSYRYLNYGAGFGDDGNLRRWSKCYNKLVKDMTGVGFTDEDVSSVCGVLSAILNLGELKFAIHNDDDAVVYIENLDILDKVAVLLAVESEDLELCLTSNLCSANENDLSSFKNAHEAEACREVLAQELYSRLFSWIVSRLNVCLSSSGDGKKRKQDELSVGFLDMFGFENLSLNSLEQLCINVANEQLQLHFTQNVFALEQFECKEEELNFDKFEYTDNKEVSSLIVSSRFPGHPPPQNLRGPPRILGPSTEYFFPVPPRELC